MNDLATILLKAHQMVLTGAPGTGKTWLARQTAQAVVHCNKDYDNPYIEFVQFHPSYTYKDFMEGLRPGANLNDMSDIDLSGGIFRNFCARAVADLAHNYVFIIDELNRGDFTKIMGEAIFAIDPSRRATVSQDLGGFILSVKDRVRTRLSTMYSGKFSVPLNGIYPPGSVDDPFRDGFFVPDNVYIIATMSESYHPAQAIDYAAMRRFAWISIKPEDTLSMLNNAEHGLTQEDAGLAKVALTALNDIIMGRAKASGKKAELYAAIADHLGDGLEIGPAYFLRLNDYAGMDNRFELLWKFHLYPLLHALLKSNGSEVHASLDAMHKAYTEAISPKACAKPANKRCSKKSAKE